jgi:hypothetical protein
LKGSTPAAKAKAQSGATPTIRTDKQRKDATMTYEQETPSAEQAIQNQTSEEIEYSISALCSSEEFEQTLAEARLEGDLSRDNVISKVADLVGERVGPDLFAADSSSSAR